MSNMANKLVNSSSIFFVVAEFELIYIWALPSQLSYSTDSYFHLLVFLYVSCVTNIKATNRKKKKTVGKSANCAHSVAT